MALVVAAGCAGLLVEDRYAATPATVPAETLAETGYERETADRLVANRTDVGGTDQDVTVVSHLRTYSRSSDGALGGEVSAGTVVVVSTPSVSVAGSEFNPVADRSVRELMVQNGDRLGPGGLRNVTERDRRRETVLGTETTVVTFDATAGPSRRPVATTVEATRVEHDGDYVVVVVAAPDRLADRERPRLRRLLTSVEHDG